MINSTDTSISALTAFQKKLDVTADNIANALTDGFKKSRVTLSEKKPSGVEAVVDRVETHGIPRQTVRNDTEVTVESSNVDLSEELPELIITPTAYGANLKTLKVQEEMMGSLLDLFS